MKKTVTKYGDVGNSVWEATKGLLTDQAKIKEVHVGSSVTTQTVIKVDLHQLLSKAIMDALEDKGVIGQSWKDSNMTDAGISEDLKEMDVYYDEDKHVLNVVGLMSEEANERHGAAVRKSRLD